MRFPAQIPAQTLAMTPAVVMVGESPSTRASRTAKALEGVVSRARDLNGQRFGFLVVESYVGSRDGKGAVYQCRCDCGATVLVRGGRLRPGDQRACPRPACWVELRKRLSPRAPARERPPEYAVWMSMRSRCTNPHNAAFANYGGRGIRVCAEWDSFDRFLAAVGQRPSPAHTLERIDNAKGYEPGNVRWATRAEQARNTRANRLVTYNGETRCVAEWEDALGFHRNVVASRLHRGWSESEALSRPTTVTRARRAS